MIKDNFIGIPVHQDDKIIIDGCFVSAGQMSFILKWCILIEGEKKYFVQNFTSSASTYTAVQKSYDMTEGFLIGVSLEVVSTTRLLNSYHATLSLGRWFSKAAPNNILLTQGYFELGHPLIWTFAGPCSNVFPSKKYLWYSGNFSVGSQFNFSWQAGAMVRLNTIQMTIVNDANAHDRIMHLEFKMSTFIIQNIIGVHVAAASETHTYIFRDLSGPEYTVGDIVTIPMAPLEFPGLVNIITNIDGWQAGDHITNYQLFCEELYTL